MLRLSNIRIPIRIAFAALLPMLAFTWLAVTDVLEKRAVVASMDQMLTVIDRLPVSTSLVHEMQRERGSSAGFVGSKGQASGGALREQRQVVDKALASWQQKFSALDRSHLSKAFNSRLDQAQTKLAVLADTRKQIDALALTVEQATGYYTATIFELLGVIEAVGDSAEVSQVTHQATALTFLSQRKERAGQERAIGNAGFSAGQFAAGMFSNFVRAGAFQDNQDTIFTHHATPAQRAFADSVLKGKTAEELNQLRAKVAESPFGGSLQGITAAKWFETSTNYINALKQVEDRMLTDVLAAVTAAGAEAQSAFWRLIAVVLVMLAITGGLVTIVILSITRPISNLVTTMASLAQGDLETAVQGTERGDEIGDMARAVVVFRDAGVEKVRLEGESVEQRKAAEAERRRNEEVQKQAAEEQAEVVKHIGTGLGNLSAGDLTFRIEAAFPPAYQQLKDDFNAAMKQLQDTVLTIVRAAHEIHSGTTEFSQATDDLSRRTETQAASLEQTAAAVDEITATVRKSADGANNAKDIVSKARTDAERSGDIVRRAVEAMTAIEGSAKQISQIIGVIDEIAFQTNLLALNAGVEAARAGDAGRGFAVVASEVRSLAQRSAEAAKEIKGLISASTAQVDGGVKLVHQTGQALDAIATQVTEINGVVGEIAASAHEQATGLAQVNTAVNQMDQVTQQNAAMVEQSTAASHALAGEAKKLTDLMSRFDVGNVSLEAAHKAPEPAKNAPPQKTNGVRALFQRAKPAGKPNGSSMPAMAATNGANALALNAQPAAEQSWEEF